MDYPGYQGAKREQEILKDMEYLQQVYPAEVKHYQKRVAQILDKMDYEGSMIYDEYPDYTSLRDMSDSIVRILQNEETGNPDRDTQTPEIAGIEEALAGETVTREEVTGEIVTGETATGRAITGNSKDAGHPEKWIWIKELIQVLLCDEIYKRRHGGKRGKIFWMNQ